jgi:hypothetical protein
MEKRNPKEIKTHETFASLFPIRDELLKKIEEDIKERNYDFSQPVILATWEGQEEPVCIDGHTRLQAAMNSEIEEVPIWAHKLGTEAEALELAIHLQRNRRNMTDAEILACIEALDVRKRAGRPKKELAQHCANFSTDLGDHDESEETDSKITRTSGKSAKAAADLMGISERKVEQVRTVMDHADQETLGAVKNGEMSVNKAYQEVQRRRSAARASATWTAAADKETHVDTMGDISQQVPNRYEEPTEGIKGETKPINNTGKAVKFPSVEPAQSDEKPRSRRKVLRTVEIDPDQWDQLTRIGEITGEEIEDLVYEALELYLKVDDTVEETSSEED